MAMTLGKDVSALFPDVLKNIATSDLDQKKLVYLYLMLVVQLIPPRHPLRRRGADHPIGIMRNHTQISVFWPSTRLHKTRKILTRLYERLLFEQWVALGWRRW